MSTQEVWYKNLPLFLLIAAIGLSPSFNFGYVPGTGRILEIRVEDILLLLFGSAWIMGLLASRKHAFIKPPLFGPILFWLSIGLFTTLLNLILSNIQAGRAFFYFLKEIEFFVLYVYIFYHIKSANTVKSLANFLLILALMNVGWVINQFAVGPHAVGYGPYGPTAIVEPGAPLPSGGFFLLLFIALINLFIYYYANLPFSKIKKVLLLIATLSPMLGVFSSGSRTSVLGLSLAIMLTPILYLIKRGNIKAVVTTFLMLILLSGMFFYFIDSKQATRGYPTNLSDIIAGLQGGRTWVWKNQINAFLENHPLYLIFGMGKSVSPVYEESHSQYVRNFIETGVAGSLAFLFLIGAILKKAFQAFARSKDPLLIAFSGGLFVMTLVMLLLSIAAEVFLSVKIDEVYWSFVAIAMATLTLQRKTIFQRG